MDQETPTTSQKAVRFLAREEVALIETVELEEPEFATASQRQRRRRQGHFMRKSVKSPRFAFSICLLTIVSALFAYWLSKYLYIQAYMGTTSARPAGLKPPGKYLYDFSINVWDGSYDLKCKESYVLSTFFARDDQSKQEALKALDFYAKEFDEWDHLIIFILGAVAQCSDQERIISIEFLDGSLIDKAKYKKYFGFDDKMQCRYDPEHKYSMIGVHNVPFTPMFEIYSVKALNDYWYGTRAFCEFYEVS